MSVLVLQSFLLILSPAFCNKNNMTYHSALHPFILQFCLYFRPLKVVGGLCAQLLKFYTDHFKTFKMFCHGLKVVIRANGSVVECLTRE